MNINLDLKMRYNQLGTTDTRVSHISLGGAAFGNLYGQAQEDQYVELIREGLRNGINYMETGYWYGQGASERVFAKALKGIPRQSYYIGSKVGRYAKEVESRFDFSQERTAFEVDQTLTRLGLNYVDIIQVHDFTFAPDLNIVRRETLPELEKAVRDGKARYIGVCDYDIDLIKELVEESEVKISTILSYAKNTLIDQRLQDYTNYFKEKDIGVINAAATGMGILSNSGPQSWHPASDEIKSGCRRAAEYCKSQNVELGRLATWFSLNQPGIDTNVCGFSNASQLRDSLQVLETGLSEHEKNVLAYVQQNFFNNGPLHWDEVELPAYRAKMSKIQIA